MKKRTWKNGIPRKNGIPGKIMAIVAVIAALASVIVYRARR